MEKIMFTDYTLDKFIAPKLSELTQCNIPDVSDKFKELTSLIDAFILNSIFTNCYNNDGIPFMFFYLRRAEAAYREFHFSRIVLLRYLEVKRENFSLYFETLFHIETCIAQLWQAILQFNSLISKATGKKERIYKKGESSYYERINLLYNASRYAGEDNIPDKATIPVWITNTGVEGKNAVVSYDELFSALNEVIDFATRVAYRKMS